MVVDLVAAERQVGRHRHGHHHGGILVLGVDPPLQLGELELDVAMAGDRLVGVLDRRQQVGDAELAGGVGDLDAAVHYFEEGGRGTMSFGLTHG